MKTSDSKRWAVVTRNHAEPAPPRPLVGGSLKSPRKYSRFAAASFLFAGGTLLAATHPAPSASSGATLATLVLLISFVAARSGSIGLTVYLIYIFVWFYLAPLVGSVFPSVSPHLTSSELGLVWLTVSVWLLGWTAGHLLVRQQLHNPPSTAGRLSPRDAGTGLITVGTVALLVEIVGAAGGQSAYATQIAGGSNTGVASIVASLAVPALVTGFVLLWPHANQRTRAFLVIAILLQAGVSSLNGFRGPAIEFLVGLGVAYLVVHPTHLHHRLRSLVLALLVILIIGIPLTLFASVQRQNQATSAGTGNHQSLSLASLPGTTIRRFDEAPALAAGLGASGPAVKQTVAMSSQFELFIPRSLWPNKPIFNYGEQISTTVYGLPASYHTSSTITWLGDLYLNGGLVFVLLSGLALAAVVQFTFERAAKGRTLTILIAVLLLQVLFSAESPLVFSLAGAFRSFILLGFVSYASGPIRRGLLNRT